MVTFKETASLYQNLAKNFNKKNPNLDRCIELLKTIKIALTELSFLPDEGAHSTREFVLARDVLEIGAQLCIMKGDIPGFERYMSQLKCYYLDDIDTKAPESPYKHQLLGLNLLYLLSQNRVAEFHTELERLPAADIQNNVYIHHPVSMEQYLMEGSYNKLFLAKGNVPAASYNFFINILLGTIRDEIAGCIENAYPTLSVQDAMHMLYFETESEFAQYASKKNWKPGPDRRYKFKSKNHQEIETTLPSSELASQVIDYARELEMIICQQLDPKARVSDLHRMSTLKETEEALYKECYQLAEKLKQLADTRESICESKPICPEDILSLNLKVLEHESRLIQESQPASTVDNPMVVADDFTSNLESEISGAKASINAGRKSLAAMQIEVEEKTVFLREQRKISKEIQESMAEGTVMETTHEASMMEVTKSADGIDFAKERRELLKKMFQFLDEHYPAARSSSSDFVPLRHIIHKLLKANVDSPDYPYIKITEDFWQPHIEVILRYNICCRHPDDSSLIRLFCNGD